MEAPASTAYNLALSPYLSTKHIQHLAFLNDSAKISYQSHLGYTLHWKEDHPPYRTVEGKWVGLAVGIGKAFISIWAVWEGKSQLLLSSKLYEDIKGMAIWDKIIVLWTDVKIIGLTYASESEANKGTNNIYTLLNTFMLSLQFLPALPSQSCNVIVDSSGHHLIAHRHPHLLIAFSQTALKRHRSPLFSKPYCSIVTQDMKWNRFGVPPVAEIIQIRLSQMGFTKVKLIKCVEQYLYFIAEKATPPNSNMGSNMSSNMGSNMNSNSSQRNSPKLYFINLARFYIENDGNRPIYEQIYAIEKGMERIIPIYANKEWEYLMKIENQLYLQVPKRQNPIQVIAVPTKFKLIVSPTPQVFPLILQQQSSPSIIVITRERNYEGTYNFKNRQISTGMDISSCILRFNTLVYCNNVELTQIDANGSLQIGRSFGKIIDLHLGSKSALIIDNPYGNACRVFELSRYLKIDPQPRVTDPRKKLLESVESLQNIKSHQLYNSTSQKPLDYLLIKTSTSKALYKESTQKPFEIFMENIFNTYEIELSKQKVLIIVCNALPNTYTHTITILSFQSSAVVKNIEITIEKPLKKVFAVSDYLLIVDSDGNMDLLDIMSQKMMKIPPIIGKGLVNLHVKTPSFSYLKANLSHIELTLIYPTTLQIYDIQIQEEANLTLLQKTEAIGEGTVFLQNSVKSNAMIDQKYETGRMNSNRFRSFTCPQYVLSSLNIQQTHECPIIKASHLTGTHLLLLTSEPGLLLYRKCPVLSTANTPIAYIYCREALPISAIRSFIPCNEIVQLGMGYVRIGLVVMNDHAEFLQLGELLKEKEIRKDKEIKCIFKMGVDEANRGQSIGNAQVWSLLNENKVRQMDFKGKVLDNFFATQIQTHIKSEMMGIDSTQQFYLLYSRTAFQILKKKDYSCHWKMVPISETLSQNILTMKMFGGNYLVMSYYDCWKEEQKIDAQQSIKFKLKIYSADSKVKIVQKMMQQPIIHIKCVGEDKLILASSFTIFVNVLRNDKTLQLIRTCTFPSKRAFLSSFSYNSEMLNKPGYMLFGGSDGGITFYFGRWIEEDKLKEQWFQCIKCSIKQIQFFHYGTELKAVVADDQGNIIVLNIKPDGCQKLADIHLDCQITTLKIRNESDKTVYICLSDGGIKTISAIQLENSSQVDFLDFQEVFCKELPMIGGFNLRGSRQLKQKYRTYKFLKKGNVVDGQLLEDYFALTFTLRKYIDLQSQINQSASNGIKSCL